jgi:ankyrin repeat protein
MTAMLLAAGADPKAFDNEHHTPGDIARSVGNAEAMKLLRNAAAAAPPGLSRRMIDSATAPLPATRTNSNRSIVGD